MKLVSANEFDIEQSKKSLEGQTCTSVEAIGEVLPIRPRNAISFLRDIIEQVESGIIEDVIVVTKDKDDTLSSGWSNRDGLGVQVSVIALASVYLAERALAYGREK